MLESVQRANEKCAFNDNENKWANNWNLSSNISMSKYRVSLGFHKNSTSIAETIPYVLIIIENGKELDLPAVQMKLCQRLIKYDLFKVCFI
jgi:hypothetical protein